MEFKLVEGQESKKDLQEALEEKGFEVKYIGQGDYVVSKNYDDLEGVEIEDYHDGLGKRIDEDRYIDMFFDDLNDVLDVGEDDFSFDTHLVKVDDDDIDVIDEIEIGQRHYDSFYKEYNYELDGYVRVTAILTIEE